jgi:hypothetical protein
MRHSDLPETCDLTVFTAPDGARGFRAAFDNHPCPDAWTEAFDAATLRVTKARRYRAVPLTEAARVTSSVAPLMKTTTTQELRALTKRLHELAARACSTTPALAGPVAKSEPEDKTALAREHLARLATTAAARVGNQAAEGGPTAPPHGGSLREVVARASQQVPNSGGARWKP